MDRYIHFENYIVIKKSNSKIKYEIILKTYVQHRNFLVIYHLSFII